MEKKEKQKDCQHKSWHIILKLIPTNRPNLIHYPKYVPQIKRSCCDCDMFLGFAKQDEKTINYINNELTLEHWFEE